MTGWPDCTTIAVPGNSEPNATGWLFTRITLLGTICTICPLSRTTTLVVGSRRTTVPVITCCADVLAAPARRMGAITESPKRRLIMSPFL